MKILCENFGVFSGKINETKRFTSEIRQTKDGLMFCAEIFGKMC